MSTYSNRLQPKPAIITCCSVLQSEIVKHNAISADVQRITLNASCMMILTGRTEQLDIIAGFLP